MVIGNVMEVISLSPDTHPAPACLKDFPEPEASG